MAVAVADQALTSSIPAPVQNANGSAMVQSIPLVTIAVADMTPTPETSAITASEVGHDGLHMTSDLLKGGNDNIPP